MALRIGPPPALARLRLYWHATRSQYLRQKSALQPNSTSSQQMLSSWWSSTTGKLARINPRIRAHTRRLAELDRFTDRYEELIDLLCWAAKDGVHTDRDTRYGEVRVWMQHNYHRVRPLLRAHLQPWDGPFDPFEELFAPENVDTVINDIAGIEYVIQTRTALEACSAAFRATSADH